MPHTPPTTNWSDTIPIADPDRTVVVTSVDAAVEALQVGPRVQSLGSRFSYPALIDGRDGHSVSLRTGRGILQNSSGSADNSPPGPEEISRPAQVVTVAGDCPLSRLWDELRLEGLTLPVCPPVITEQTVAGAIATGTHSQGLREGLLSDFVVAVNYLDASGNRRRTQRGEDDFGAFQLHLGALGLITEVEFEVEPNRLYHCHKTTVTGAELAAGFADWTRLTAHTKAWWFVDEDRAHVWLVEGATRSATTRGTHPTPTADDPRHDLNAIIRSTQARMGRDTSVADDSAAPQRTVGRFLDYEDLTGDLVDIFRNGIPAPQINMEVGVPLTHFNAAMTDLARVVRESRFHLHYPVILRPTGPSSAWLSAAYDRETVWFGFVVYQRPDGSVPDGSMELLDDIQGALAAHDGFPHWGKYFDPQHFDLSRLPRWADFQQVRRRLDPGGRFLNPTLATVLEPGA